MKNIADYTDEKGFICHLDVDGRFEAGDSAQRTFTLDMIKALEHHEPMLDLSLKFEEKIRHILKDEPRRHWDESKWPGRKGFMSRDNILPVLVCCSLLSPWFLVVLTKMITARYGFLWNTKKIGQQNGDWKIPDIIGVKGLICILRGFFAYQPSHRIWIYPTLNLLDLLLVLDSLIRCLVGWIDPDNVGDDLNHSILLAQAKEIAPTPFSFLARKLYVILRPKSGIPSFRLGFKDDNGPLLAWRWYFRHDQAPPMADLMAPILRKF